MTESTFPPRIHQESIMPTYIPRAISFYAELRDAHCWIPRGGGYKSRRGLYLFWVKEGGSR